MTPERWREIERLYYAALDRDAVERTAFLNEACGSDEALRREVESLFVYQTKAKDFIEAPATTVHLGLLSRVLAPVRAQHESSASGRFVGRSLGVYEVKALIGSGGMGEVYRAIDTRINRTVAIKVLPEHVSSDPERRQRFKREATIISTLNHPHICALYDIGSQDGVDYLVMEHIDGETLQYRLEQGELPLTRALEYSIQICDALDRAHRRGVTHRDLKPANVMLTKAGVKLLDFGAATSGAPADEIASDVPRNDGPRRLIGDGVILGTLQYMSPEQLQGMQADGRTDIFAFGAVVYEMITGKKALRAASQAGLVSAILRDDVQPIADLVPQIPPPLAQAIARCLSKDPDERWQTASDLLFQLRSIAATPPTVASRESQARKRSVERALWTVAVLAAVFVTLAWVRTRDARPGDPAPMATAIRFNLVPAEGTALYSGYGVPFALSPDGRQIVYVGDDVTGTRQLWLRSLYSEEEQPLPGTEGATTPFWSPDNQWIGFFADNSLKKIRVSSGIAQLVAGDLLTYGGAAWNADDVIVFPAGLGGLSRVSAQGGPVSRITKGEGSHFWPQFLADGEHFIYAAAAPAGLYIGSLRSEAPRALMKFPVRISSLAYVPGYVFFVQDAALFARAFDETRLEFSGDAIQILDGIPVTGPGRASFSLSAAGVLAYWPYPAGTPAVLRWFQRDGRTSPLLDAPAQYVGFALSPDERQLVFSRVTRTGGADIWLRDLSRGSESRLTFDGAAFTPQWSPDGTRIVFSGPGRSPPPKLFIRTLAGAGAASPLGDSATPNFASSWSGDGQSIVSVRIDPAARNDLWVQRLEDTGGEPLPFNTPFNESNGKVSPDGRWIAYVTDQSGKEEVWVASFPSGTMRRQVSVRGGTSAQWNEASTELYYISDDKQLMAVRFSGGQSGVELRTPQVLFPIKDLAELDQLVFPTANGYVAAATGQRFLVAVRARDPDAPPIRVVVDWRALLKR
jgi:serine/threonine protein kinase/Tol biopolymer transport system component